MKRAIVIVGLGELGGVFARGFLRTGYPVYPLTRAINIADAVKPPRAQRKEMQVWNEREIMQFLEAAKSTTYYEIFYLALFTGMRRSELLALRWQDIDFVENTDFVTHMFF